MHLDANGLGPLPVGDRSRGLLLLSEALQNIAKYAGANEAIIRLARSNGDLMFEVVDDGRGFDLTTAGGSGS